MNHNQRQLYLLLLMAGREEEATEYRDRCENLNEKEQNTEEKDEVSK